MIHPYCRHTIPVSGISAMPLGSTWTAAQKAGYVVAFMQCRAGTTGTILMAVLSLTTNIYSTDTQLLHIRMEPMM